MPHGNARTLVTEKSMFCLPEKRVGVFRRSAEILYFNMAVNVSDASFFVRIYQRNGFRKVR